jgi:hypothetical protein
MRRLVRRRRAALAAPPLRAGPCQVRESAESVGVVSVHPSLRDARRGSCRETLRDGLAGPRTTLRLRTPTLRLGMSRMRVSA